MPNLFRRLKDSLRRDTRPPVTPTTTAEPPADPVASSDQPAAPPANPTPPPISDDDAELSDIAEALQTLVKTRDWAAKRTVVEQKQAVLLSNRADGMLATMIERYRASADTNERNMADDLDLHRTLLHRCREIGIAGAWPEFEATAQVAQRAAQADQPATSGDSPADQSPPLGDADPVAVVQTLNAFINAPDWDETRAILEREQELLLTPTADEKLAANIVQYSRDKDRKTAGILRRHRELLRRCRFYGIAAAWEDFSAIRQAAEMRMGGKPPVTQTLIFWLITPIGRRGTITARSRQAKRRGLEEHPELLAPENDIALRALLWDRYGDGGWDETTLRDALQLLGDVRARGGTIEAIREGCINAYGGFTLDLPSWLDEFLYDYVDGLGVLRGSGQRTLTAEERTTLIHALRETLRRATTDATVPPEAIAALQSELSDTVSLDSLEPRVEAPEEAIEMLTAASTICTFERYPRQYAHMQDRLGVAYRVRLLGSKKENLQAALRCHQEALRVRTLALSPQEYASTQMDLGHTYGDYGQYFDDNRLENLERSMECYREALRVYTMADTPDKYATVQIGLGANYRVRLAGNPQENLERSIECYREALRVYTLEDFPRDYALAQYNLGNAYTGRTAGIKRENLEAAIQCYHEALQVRTLVDFPSEFRNTQVNLAVCAMLLAKDAASRGDAAARRTALELAHNAFQGARQAQAELGWEASDAQSKASLLGEQPGVQQMYVNDAWCLWQLGRPREAVVALEAGRAQALSEAQAIIGVVLDGLCRQHRDQFLTIRQELDEARARGERSQLRAARDRFLAAREAVRDHCLADFLPSEPAYDAVASAPAPEQALVYLAAANQTGFACIVPPATTAPNAEQRSPVIVPLPRLTWQAMSSVEVHFDSGSRFLRSWELALKHRAARGLASSLVNSYDRAELRRILALPLRDLVKVIPDDHSVLRQACERTLQAWRDEADILSGGTVREQARAQMLRERLMLPLCRGLCYRLRRP